MSKRRKVSKEEKLTIVKRCLSREIGVLIGMKRKEKKD